MVPIPEAQVRAALLTHGGQATSTPATQSGYSVYTASVGIGSPPAYYNLIVDTGSSIAFWETANVTYGSGGFTGPELTLAPNLVITNQSISDALHSTGFQGVDGILGLGPLDLTRGVLSPDKNSTIQTVMDNLVSQKLINHEELGVGVYFAPATSENDTDGVLTYGSVDRNLYKGELTYTPVTTTCISSRYWGINVSPVTYGKHSIFPNSAAGIVDTGITLIILADEPFNRYLNATQGAKMDANISLTEIPESSISQMQPLSFAIGGQEFVLDVAAQLLPRRMNKALGGDPDKYYGTVRSFGGISPSGFEFILGQAFMERYYAIFDSENKRVGFAQTNNTFTVYQG